MERGPREIWDVGLGDVQEAGDTLLCTSLLHDEHHSKVGTATSV